MRATVTLSNDKHCYVRWALPYLYPDEGLTTGIDQLRQLGYSTELLSGGDGIIIELNKRPFDQKLIDNVAGVFVWIQFRIFESQDAEGQRGYLNNQQIVILPISRLEIQSSIYTETICLFPPGEFQVEQLVIRKQDGRNISDSPTSTNLRDQITELTELSIEVFTHLPLVVFSYEIDIDSYRKFNHKEDNVLIKALSNRAENIFDIIRFYFGNFNQPEFMPARAGLWGEKYSTALIYFVKENFATAQAREVEVKTFVMSIGIDVDKPELIQNCPLLKREIGETGNIAKHALRLNSNILEGDNLTLKFSQIMTLFEFLATPYEFKKFQDSKGKIGLHVTTDQTEYNKLMHRFKELTKGNETGNDGLRTSIVHKGKLLEELIPNVDDQIRLFSELQGYIKRVIDDMILNYSISWSDFQTFRNTLRETLNS